LEQAHNNNQNKKQATTREKMRDDQYPYIQHGSENSLDDDVVYIFPGHSLPDKQVCLEFCNYHKNENRNVFTLDTNTRVVRECLKGLPDELNNSLRRTFTLHEQVMEHNPIEQNVERVIVLKVVRAVRSVLSRITRTQLRVNVKKALQSNLLTSYLMMMNQFSFNQVSEVMDIEACKAMAFQLSQTFALIHNYNEIWTKNEVSQFDSQLEIFMKRDPTCVEKLDILDQYKTKIVNEMQHITTERVDTKEKKPSTLNIVLTTVPISQQMNSVSKQCIGIVLDMKPGFERCIHWGLDADILISIASEISASTICLIYPFIYHDQLVIASLRYDVTSGVLSRDYESAEKVQQQYGEQLKTHLQESNIVDFFVTYMVQADTLKVIAVRNKYTNKIVTSELDQFNIH
jgi:hypothetical protein